MFRRRRRGGYIRVPTDWFRDSERLKDLERQHKALQITLREELGDVKTTQLLRHAMAKAKAMV